MSCPPPGLTQDRWVRLLDECRQMDDRYNRAETVGKPRLTSGNAGEQRFDQGKMARNNSGPGGASTPRDPASPTKES